MSDGAAVDDGGVGPRPARPNDPAALSRGRSSAEPTARRSGMAATTPPMGRARKRVAHGHRSTEVRGCRAGKLALRAGVSRQGLGPPEAEAARLPPTWSARQWLGARDSCHAWQGRCALWYSYAYHGRERPAVALSKRPVSM